MTWIEYFMSLAKAVATKSKDPSTKVGAVAVGACNEILSTGFNGIPRGLKDLPERLERPEKYKWVSHAEENLVAQAALVGVSLQGSTVYVTHMPCNRCARMLINAGVSSVIVGDGVTSMPEEEVAAAKTMFDEAAVLVWR